MPGFIITGELGTSPTRSTWAAVRTVDDHRFVLKIFWVSDVMEARALARKQIASLHRNDNEHLVRQHDAIALADGTLALVLDEVTGGSLAEVLGARGQLTPGETVTTLAPLFGALARLHTAGVVHGDLGPGTVVFSADGMPLISDLGVATLMDRPAGPPELFSGFVAPELVGAAPAAPAAPAATAATAATAVTATPACDVYAMAAIGWYSLAGAPPAPANLRPSLSTLRPGTPTLLVELLTSCLSTDPGARPSAAAASALAFDAAPAEPVALMTALDPATEITRRIRLAAASAATLSPPPIRRGYRPRLAVGMATLLVSVLIGGAATWLLRGSPADQPANAKPAAHSLTTAAAKVARMVAPSTSVPWVTTPSVKPSLATSPSTTSRRDTNVRTSFDSPPKGAAASLQALVDARALAYVARNPALLDLAYAPGAAKAGVDRANIATALKNRATYLRLSFVVRDAAYLNGTSDTARVRATIVTPAYETGQPDGRKVAHLQETVGPSVFSLKLTRDGWRILSLTGP